MFLQPENKILSICLDFWGGHRLRDRSPTQFCGDSALWSGHRHDLHRPNCMLPLFRNFYLSNKMHLNSWKYSQWCLTLNECGLIWMPFSRKLQAYMSTLWASTSTQITIRFLWNAFSLMEMVMKFNPLTIFLSSVDKHHTEEAQRLLHAAVVPVSTFPSSHSLCLRPSSGSMPHQAKCLCL